MAWFRETKDLRILNIPPDEHNVLLWNESVHMASCNKAAFANGGKRSVDRITCFTSEQCLYQARNSGSSKRCPVHFRSIPLVDPLPPRIACIDYSLIWRERHVERLRQEEIAATGTIVMLVRPLGRLAQL